MIIKKTTPLRQGYAGRGKKVFVGISGGVDSAVSSALLKKEGYDVIGVFIKTWHPDFIKCNEEEERLDAMRIAAHLDIPFLTFDFSDIYKKEVADYMISEYKNGRTPNPDVMCNKQVKFGAFLKKAISMGADFVATGHYAMVDFINNTFSQVLGSPRQTDFVLGIARPDHSKKYYFLRRGQDLSKDQSYFLWTLKQEQLAKILFPIGHLKKTEVRRLAKKYKLPVAEKKDSQGICFLGDIDLKVFLKHYIKEKKGIVINIDGEKIGYHEGVFFYTIGERRSFVITKKTSNDKPYYVVAKDIKKNILIVSQNKNIFHSNILTNIRIKNINWISDIPKIDKKYTAQIRYHGEYLPCTIICQSKAFAETIFEKPINVASGQSIVIYENDICLGGGVVI